MFGFKSMVAKFAFWSVVLLVLVGVTVGKRSGTTRTPARPTSTYWQGQYKNAAAQLATDPTRQRSRAGAPIEVKQVTVLQFPLLKADGTQQQRVDRCQSCHVGLLDPNMTAEKLIKVLDEQDDTDHAGRGLSERSQARATLDAIKTLGAHPGIRVETKDNPHDLGVIHGATLHLRHHDRGQPD